MNSVWLTLLIGMNVIWAASYPIYKMLGAHLTSGAIATLRFSMAAAILTALWRWLPGPGPRGRDLIRALAMGLVVFCIAPRLQIEGVHRGFAGDTSLLIALDPLIVTVAAAIFLREQIAARRWWGFGLGISGVFLLSHNGGSSSAAQPLSASILFLASFVCEAVYSIMGKPMLGRVSMLKLLAVALVGGSAANVTMELASDGGHVLATCMYLPASAWGWLAFMAIVCTLLGYALWYAAIRVMEVNVAGLTVFVQPVVGFALSVLWIGETPHWGQLWGSLMILLGLMVGLRNPALVAGGQWCKIFFSWIFSTRSARAGH